MLLPYGQWTWARSRLLISSSTLQSVLTLKPVFSPHVICISLLNGKLRKLASMAEESVTWLSCPVSLSWVNSRSLAVLQCSPFVGSASCEQVPWLGTPGVQRWPLVEGAQSFWWPWAWDIQPKDSSHSHICFKPGFLPSELILFSDWFAENSLSY